MDNLDIRVDKPINEEFCFLLMIDGIKHRLIDHPHGPIISILAPIPENIDSTLTKIHARATRSLDRKRRLETLFNKSIDLT